jgi:hypothetical protein
MLAENKPVTIRFLTGLLLIPAGVVAEAGFEIVHVRLANYVPLRAGFDAVEAHLLKAGRPIAGDLRNGIAIAEAIQLYGLQ